MAKCLAQKQEDGTLAGVGGASSMVTAAKLAALVAKVKQGCFPNEQIIITTSGDWEAPATGFYHILAIDGGSGGQYDNGDWAHGGNSGAYKEAVAFFEKGQVVPITIGAGGKGYIGATAPASKTGGITFVGDIDFSVYANRVFVGDKSGRVSGSKSARVAGGGWGGSFGDGFWYGGGGGASASISGTGHTAHDGANGVVIMTYFNFDLPEGGE